MNGKFVGRDVVLQKTINGLGGIQLQFRKIGRIVQLTINSTTNAYIYANTDTIATVPKMYRPLTSPVFIKNQIGDNVFLFPDSSGKIISNMDITVGSGIWAFTTYIGRAEMSLQEGET